MWLEYAKVGSWAVNLVVLKAFHWVVSMVDLLVDWLENSTVDRLEGERADW